MKPAAHWIAILFRACMFGLLGLVVNGASASEGPPRVLHLTTYRSPSGEFALTVDPSHLHGHGPGTCTVTRHGTAVWSRQLDFTFWEAGITDEGVVAGYGYTNGRRGFAPDRRSDRGYGEFIVAVLDPAGGVRAERRTPRKDTRALHAPPEPLAQGCFLDPSNDRLVVRFTARDGGRPDGERWEVAALSTGEGQPPVHLRVPPASGPYTLYHAMQAQPLGATGLVLVTWSRTERGPGGPGEGVRLALVDPAGAEVWSLERPAEFAGVVDFNPRDIPLADLTPRVPGAADTVVFRSVADQARISYAVSPDPAAPSGWSVREAARRPEEVRLGRRGDDEPLTLPGVNLEPRGQIALDRGGDDTPVLGISDFCFDGAGRVGFVSTEAPEGFELTLLSSTDGTVHKRVPLGFGHEDGHVIPEAVCVGGARWIVLRGSDDDQRSAEGYWLDADAGTVTRIEGFNCPAPAPQHGVAATGDGGFAVLGDDTSEVLCFDAQGRQRWRAEPPGVSPQAIGTGTTGEVGVLIGIEDRIVVLDREGRRVRSIELNESLGAKPNYVAGLAGDTDGGWILHDFGGTPPVYRLAADGTVRAGFAPRYADGRTFRLYGGVKRGPDGRLWTSDRAAVLRLDDQGVVDRVVGRGPDADSIGELLCLAVDHAGRLYGVDGRNASVHVFDASGKRLRVFKPEPDDFPVDAGIGLITVAGDGSVYYQPDQLGERGYLKFDADGTRAGFQPRISDEVSEEWHFRPGGQERLVLGYERAFQVDAQGRVVRPVERRADGRWLGHPGSGAVAADGSFVIVASPSTRSQGGSPSVTVFSAAGEPVRTLDLPPGFRYARVAFNGRTACVVSDDSLVLFDAADDRARAFTIPDEGGEGRWWRPYCSPDGAEVWLLDAEGMRLVRYALPMGPSSGLVQPRSVHLWSVLCLIGSAYALAAAAFNPRLVWPNHKARIGGPAVGETGLRVWCLVLGLLLLGVGVAGMAG